MYLKIIFQLEKKKTNKSNEAKIFQKSNRSNSLSANKEKESTENSARKVYTTDKTKNIRGSSMDEPRKQESTNKEQVNQLLLNEVEEMCPTLSKAQLEEK